MNKAVTSAALAVILSSGTSLAATPDLTCESAKLKASSSFASCAIKTYRSALLHAEVADPSVCNGRITDKFPGYETSAGVGVCPSESDASAISTFLAACATGMALELSGGDLWEDPDACVFDLPMSAADVAACQASCTSTVHAALRTGEKVAHGAGSDGALRPGAIRSYTDNGDGTITDNTTGLMWEKKDLAGGMHDLSATYTWSTGSHNMDGTIVSTFLAALNAGSGFAGHTDWRIPNRFELDSISDLGTGDVVEPFSHLCGDGCSSTTCGCQNRGDGYWSSTSYVSNPGSIWWSNNGTHQDEFSAETGARAARGVRTAF
jgi:hypothetical protein